ncbi:hypothetical protein FRC12_011606 [Ceratobasidium sp. 428]|nr:hypothetical protein FRC12_011606 [Ceratobasidium sp. 428]
MSGAYTEVFTPENIQEAFRKTGVIPLNWSMISSSSLAPALESSVKGSLPIRQPAPIQEVVGILNSALTDETGASEDSFTAKTIRTALTSTSVAYLASPAEIPAEHESLPLPTRTEVEPLSAETQALFTFIPHTDNESRLLNALQEFADRDRQHTEAANAATATAVLQGMYCERLKRQLFEKQSTSQKGSGRLLGNGLPVVLTSDAFIKRVAAKESQRNRDEELKKARKEAKSKQKAVTDAWKKEERERIDRNKADAEMYKLDLVKWEVERDMAKQENRLPGWKKPVKPVRRPPVPKPVLKVAEESEESDSSEEGSDGGYESAESADD